MKIPKKVQGLGGPIRVEVVAGLRNKGVKVAGLWHAYKRLIQISDKLPLRDQRHTMYHELIHAALDDSGIRNTLDSTSQEVLCDLLATAFLRSEDK